MEVTVELAGDRTETVTIEGGTYADLLAAVGLSPQEATVIVDGRPVPADETVTADTVEVLRLISGGGDQRSADGARIRPATIGEATAAIDVLDRAILAFERSAVRAGIIADDVLVAVLDDEIRGVLLLDGPEITAVAVDRPVRDRGIGSALVRAAAERRDHLEARFPADVRPFYESLGFEIVRENGRCYGVLAATP